MTYEQAYKDHCFLWDIGPANDMTGGYVDSEDLDKMLKNPTKATAKKCLVRQINYWFESGMECGTENKWTQQSYESVIAEYPEVEKILERYSPGYIW